MEHLFCAKYCAKCWGHSSHKDRYGPQNLPIAMEKQILTKLLCQQKQCTITNNTPLFILLYLENSILGIPKIEFSSNSFFFLTKRARLCSRKKTQAIRFCHTSVSLAFYVIFYQNYPVIFFPLGASANTSFHGHLYLDF